ncbi:hypothetical protein [Octadecabacter antarcticus]|uniref:hypothetical protein n=1 Tax=Octadecabacter antarcticus TaxID=1217908 RepID=UPI00018065B9|nr:hypothetical protein [Octadecabacter antarcticus]
MVTALLLLQRFNKKQSSILRQPREFNHQPEINHPGLGAATSFDLWLKVILAIQF